MNKLKLLLNKLNIRKSDPVYKCTLANEIGCAHIDGFLCDFPYCVMNKKYEKEKLLKEFMMFIKERPMFHIRNKSYHVDIVTEFLHKLEIEK